MAPMGLRLAPPVQPHPETGPVPGYGTDDAGSAYRNVNVNWVS